ncbi:MAG: transposase family protein [Candidatus Nitrosocosmicus sp.]|nr:transposase family protein [Candidatus Nitrosocosmicus sp.]MDN5868884.1 transposase family protein [Candidatus Nitrosocosmicus sp.]
MTSCPENHYSSSHLQIGLSVKQFDDIYKVIESEYPKHEIKRLCCRKDRKERSVGAGRRFILVPKVRVIRVLVYYRLCITYTLTGFMFDLDQSNVYRDIQNIEGLIRSCLPIPQKLYNITKD